MNKTFKYISLLVLLVLVLVPLAAALADTGVPVVTSGFEENAVIKTAVQFANFNSSGSTSKELFLGLAGYPNGAPNIDITWKTSNHITISYVPSTLTVMVENSAGTKSLSTTITDPGILNYFRLDIVKRGNGTTVALNNVVLNQNPIGEMNQFAVLTPNASGELAFSITGLEVTNGFTLEGDILLSSKQVNGLSNYIQVSLGHYDDEGPVARDLVVGPSPIYLNGPYMINAVIDDNTTDKSPIASAEFNLNGGAFGFMSPLDGAWFDEDFIEEVYAGFDANQVGENVTCVHGTDAFDPANTGDNTCAPYVVEYVLDGFYDPVYNDLVNEANAGQAIPMKWRLTDYWGTPISDPASFVGLYSYPISCTDLIGDPEVQIEEYASGSSGLQYIGDGYWQFNWKTPKIYKGTCANVYILFNSTTTSNVVTFQFK